MPTEREAVVNKALSGIELKQLILRDFTKLLDEDGMLTKYTAYGRCAYDIRLRIHTDNMTNRMGESFVNSRPESRHLLETQPQLGAMEGAPPLRDPSEDSQVGSVELLRNVNSPNAERLNAWMPVTVDTREQDGSKIQKSVTYPVPEAGEIAESVGMTDTTAQTRKDWDLKPVAPLAAPAPSGPVTPVVKGPGPQSLTPVTPVPGTAPVVAKKDA